VEDHIVSKIIAFPSGNTLSLKRILFLLMLVAVTATLTLVLNNRCVDMERGRRGMTRIGAWGELIEFNLRMEQSDEYLGFEIDGEG
jgi:hypothetical protein